MSTMGKGGVKGIAIKKACEANYVKRRAEILNQDEKLQGEAKLEFELSTLTTRIRACEYDMKYSGMASNNIVIAKLAAMKEERTVILKQLEVYNE